MIPPRVLVIGIDGLNLDLIFRLLPADTLPTLHSLIAKGAVGDLRSVFPTHSAAAWASFITGQTPAAHGIFDFTVRLPDGHYRHAKPDPTQTLWHRLGEQGFRVGIFNFPVTFPPDAVNGWLVSGMLSPDVQRFAYPPTLADEINHAFPDYQLDVEWLRYENRPADLLRALTAMTRQRGEVARYLLKREPLDFFAIAFIATDRAQHALWRFLDAAHPFYDEKEAVALLPAIHEFYRSLDTAIASLMEMASPETLVILLSDHGFQAAAWQFHANDWLSKQGWLKFKPSAGKLERWMRRLDTPRLRSLRKRLFTDISRHVPAFTPGGTIDWPRTRAFCPWNFHQGIRINVQGRDPYGVVGPGDEYENLREEIAIGLQQLRFPERGEAVVAAVFRREELYEGPYLEAMPDIIFDLRPNFAPGIHRQTLFEATGWVSGDHSSTGFVLLAGTGVSPGKIEAARLIDLAPTVLHAFGIPIASTIQGKPLRNSSSERNSVTVVPSSSGRNSGTVVPSSSDIERAANHVRDTVKSAALPFAIAETPPSAELSSQEEGQMLERLRNLGYL